MIDLVERTGKTLQQHPGEPLLVGFSGGPDSSALLDVLTRIPGARKRGLRALHVHHGLHPDADDWADHCRTFCKERDVPLQVARVAISKQGNGPEGDARDARMQAFAERLNDGEALLLAHHRLDQAETILLKLLRGAGPHGLAGMRVWRAFARGWLWRPWLDIDQDLINNWIEHHGLSCIDDPANHDPTMTRSWLRQDIMPRIRAHLPAALASIVQSGRLCGQTRDELDETIESLAHLIGNDGSLDAEGWLAQADSVRGLLLEHWLHQRGLAAPTTAQRAELERQASTAATDRVPLIHWPGTDVRIWRKRLHALPPLPELPIDWQASWPGGTLQLPLGTLHLGTKADAPPVPMDPPLRVCLRRGGEYLHPAGDHCGRQLRYVFQQSGLPPWLRPFCPLIHADEQLLAVGNLCLTEAGKKYFSRLGVQPYWRYHA